LYSPKSTPSVAPAGRRSRRGCGRRWLIGREDARDVRMAAQALELARSEDWQDVVDDSASIALRGMPSNFADLGSWAKVIPRHPFDGPLTLRCRRGRSGEHDTDRALPQLLRGRGNSPREGAIFALRSSGSRRQDAGPDYDVGVRRDDVDAVGNHDSRRRSPARPPSSSPWPGHRRGGWDVSGRDAG
jgi:hypothetical protein